VHVVLEAPRAAANHLRVAGADVMALRARTRRPPSQLYELVGGDCSYGSIGAEVGEEALQWRVAMWVVVRVSGKGRLSARTSVVDLHDSQSWTFTVLESSGTRPA